MQTVELKVSMHCYGCAKKVQKHIAKMDGMSRRTVFFWFMGETDLFLG
jgi:copper chaperone CopZ